MSSAAWDPVSGGLYSNGEFLSCMDRANNPSMPGLCMLSILGEVGLKNDGHLAAKRDCEVFVTFYLSCDPSLQPMFPLQRTGEAKAAKPPEQEKKLSKKRADNSQRPANTIRKLDPAPRGPCRSKLRILSK